MRQQQADEALLDALLMDEKLADYWDDRVAADPAAAAVRPPRLAQVYHNRALLDALLGDTQAAQKHRAIAIQLDESLAHAGDAVVPAGAGDLPLVDAWTWRESYFGDKLVSRDNCVRLVVLQLTNEFMAVDNIQVLRQIETVLQPVRDHLSDWVPAGLVVLQSGSAAVGADLLRSAAGSIKNTEVFTIVLVVLILALVYRAPLLVAVPVVTILASLLVSTGLVALLTQLDQVPGFGWWTLKVFSTTKIFVVVILFGAGTDYCLFLIARYKEELQAGLPHEEAVSAALTHVGDALAASALTTVLGLGMMFFAEFGKFCYSGPVIGLCLALTLLTCMTLTPAIMTGLGPMMFWPFGVTRQDRGAKADGVAAPRRGSRSMSSLVWHFVARKIVTRPGTILIGSVVVLLPLACYGLWNGGDVTYDFLSELPATCPSKQGAEVLRRHFPVGESGPVTVLIHKNDAPFETPPGREQIRHLSDLLHLPGVLTVRSAEDPLGEYAPGEKPGILSERGRTLARVASPPANESHLRRSNQGTRGKRRAVRNDLGARSVFTAGHSGGRQCGAKAARTHGTTGHLLVECPIRPDRHHCRYSRPPLGHATRQHTDSSPRRVGRLDCLAGDSASAGRLPVHDADRALQLLRDHGLDDAVLCRGLRRYVSGARLESASVPVRHPGGGGTGLQRLSGDPRV